MLLSVMSILYGFARLAIAAGMLYVAYWFGRTMLRRSGGLQALNPLQPGWRQLHEQYESMQNVPRMTTFSARIGGVWYNDVLQIGFDAQDVVIRNNAGFSSLVRIPYRHLEVLQQPAPFQTTSLSDTEYTPSLFRAGTVEIGLDAYWAGRLLQQMAAADSQASS